MLSRSNSRLAAARRLIRPPARRAAGRFLAEGAPAVREALAAGVVVEMFATAEALERHAAVIAGAPVSEISDKDAAALSETVNPQGLVAVCRTIDVPLIAALGAASPCGEPTLAVGLIEPNDPGNAGTILRSADAAGAAAVIFVGGVDPYNGKLVRASAGSMFHLRLAADHASGEPGGEVRADGPGFATGVDPGSDLGPRGGPTRLVEAARRAGLRVLATSGGGVRQLDELVDGGELAEPTLWLFGNEARGLPEDVLAAADATVRVPIYGRAESLNLAAAAAVCLYASARARAHRRPPNP